MILKFLLILAVFYLIARAVVNLWNATRPAGADRFAGQGGFEAPPRRTVNGRRYDAVISTREAPPRRNVTEMIEEARYKDV
jgi:hypothetical protein